MKINKIKSFIKTSIDLSIIHDNLENEFENTVKTRI
jgi:hypothetical protein